MTDKKTFEKIVGRIGDLPALPMIVAEVLRLTEDPATSTREVSEAIQSDPAMAAKVLRVSNSPYYGMKQFVGTLKLALVILGVREVRNIVLGISVFETLNEKDSDMRMAQQLWNESLRVAASAKRLSTELGLGLPGETFISGLLSDIGKMALLRFAHDPYAKILAEHRADPEALVNAEQQEFGFTHAGVSMALAMRWNLPKTLADALWYQYPVAGHDLDDAKDPVLAAVLRIARAACHPAFGKANAPVTPGVGEAWRRLDNVKHPVPEDKRREVLLLFLKELESAPRLMF